MKFKALAIVAAGAFALTSAFAGDKGECGSHVGNKGKMACASYANLNLTAEQKTKMDTLAEDCHKGGCNEATMAKMTMEAEKVLTKEQFATWKKASHGDKKSEKTQS